MKGNHKRKSEWCWGCDAEFVPIGKKCKNCGYRNNTKLKAPTSAELINEYRNQMALDLTELEKKLDEETDETLKAFLNSKRQPKKGNPNGCSCTHCTNHDLYRWATISECGCACHKADHPVGHTSMCCEYVNGKLKDNPYTELKPAKHYKDIMIEWMGELY